MRLGAIVVRSLREGALWVFGALALIVLAALITYDRNDPSFATTGEPGPISNAIGPLGAHLSGLLIMLFGAPAFLFPIMLGRRRLAAVPGSQQGEHAFARTVALRAVGFVLTLITSCGLATPAFHRRRAIRSTAGGVLGSLRRARARRGLELPRRHAVAARAVARGRVAVHRRVVDRDHGPHRPRDVAAALGWLREPRLDRARLKAGREVQAGAQEGRARRAEESRERAAAADRAAPRPRSRRASASRRSARSPLFEPPAASELPPLSLLDDPPPRAGRLFRGSARGDVAAGRAQAARISASRPRSSPCIPGPVITRFELEPAPGVKVSQITNLAKDLARGLSVVSVRVVEVIPGKSVVGLEIPNEKREMVTLGEILQVARHTTS